MTIPQLDLTVISKNKNEFSLEEWEKEVQTNPLFYAQWTLVRKNALRDGTERDKCSMFWFPEHQETNKVFYFIPTPIDKTEQ